MIYRIISLGCAISLGLWAQAASAQDRWAGTYGGIALSGIDAKAGISSSTTHSFRDKHATLGIYAGKNYVRSNGFVWGPDVVLSGLSSSGGASDAAFGSTEMKGSFLLSPRLRAGFATDQTFFYGVLGLGISDLSVKQSGASGTSAIISGAFGVGAEIALQDGWSARIEAMHYDFDGLDYVSGGVSTPIKAEAQTVTFGLSRKF